MTTNSLTVLHDSELFGFDCHLLSVLGTAVTDTVISSSLSKKVCSASNDRYILTFVLHLTSQWIFLSGLGGFIRADEGMDGESSTVLLALGTNQAIEITRNFSQAVHTDMVTDRDH